MCMVGAGEEEHKKKLVARDPSYFQATLARL